MWTASTSLMSDELFTLIHIFGGVEVGGEKVTVDRNFGARFI